MNDLSMHLMDIIQNAVFARATCISLEIAVDELADTLKLSVIDNGKGMTAEEVAKVEDPFFTSRTTRRVGFGVPLFKQSAVQSGGSLKVESEVGQGTTVTTTFGYSHIDRPPLGNVANAFVLMMSSNLGVRFGLKYSYNGREYRFDSLEVKDVLGDLPLNDTSIIKMLVEIVEENIEDLKT